MTTGRGRIIIGVIMGVILEIIIDIIIDLIIKIIIEIIIQTIMEFIANGHHNGHHIILKQQQHSRPLYEPQSLIIYYFSGNTRTVSLEESGSCLL
jgi:hypothetical protein